MVRMHQRLGTDESMTRMDSLIPLMYYDLSGLALLIRIRITTKEHTLTLLSLNEHLPCAQIRLLKTLSPNCINVVKLIFNLTE